MKRVLTFCLALVCATQLAAAELGDDGLHKTGWMRDTFKDLGEDLAEAEAEGKRLLLLVEQRGCIYCAKMHKEVFSDPTVEQMIVDNFFVVQLNLHGDTEVTDLDGDVLSEKEAVRKWGVLFTPTMIFVHDAEDVQDGESAVQAAAAVMPGAFGKGTTLDMLTWIAEKRYKLDTEEDFQRYHARRIQERSNGSTD